MENNNMKTKDQLSLEYDRSINRLGRTTSIIALAFMILVPLGTMIYFDLDISVSEILLASSSLIIMFLPMSVVENISYYAVIGAGGMYLGSITGNILNMKLPCAISGMKIAGVEPGSREGDVISVIAIGVSSVVNTIVLILGMFVIGSFILPILNSPVLSPGFANITPAILGAVTIPNLLESKKLSIVPIIAALAAYFIIGPKSFGKVQSYVLIVIMALSVVSAYLMNKKSKKEN
jgi:hypothetical protein